MPTTIVIDDEPILVEFAPRQGLQQVSLSPEDVTQKSAMALNSAMKTIRQMARRVAATARSLPVAERPSQIEVEFGLKLDAQAGALVAQAGAEASFTVKLTCERKEPQRSARPRRARH
jgi:hypothetical protein